MPMLNLATSIAGYLETLITPLDLLSSLLDSDSNTGQLVMRHSAASGLENARLSVAEKDTALFEEPVRAGARIAPKAPEAVT
jgi:hypothetical protein